MNRPDITAIRDRCEKVTKATSENTWNWWEPVAELKEHSVDDIPALLDYIAELEADLKVHKEAIRRQAHISVQKDAEITRLHAALVSAHNTAVTISSLEGQKGNW